MNVFRVLLIICAIALIALLIVSVTVEATYALTLAIAIVGIATALFAIIATIMWWITDEANAYNANQLSHFRMSHR